MEENTTEDVVSTSEESNQETEDQSTGQQDAVDYKSAYEQMQSELKAKEKQLSQAEYTIMKEKEKHDRRVQKDEESVEDSSTEDVMSMKNEIAEQIRKEMSEATLSEELIQASDNEDERKLIKLFYDNKIIKSGYDRQSVKADVELARFLANKPRIDSMSKEMIAKNNSDKSKTKTGTSGSQNISGDSDGSGMFLSDADKALMVKYNITAKDLKS